MNSSIILSVLATGALLATASAGPQLQVETVVTEYLEPKGAKVLGRIRGSRESGKPTTALVGNYEFTVKSTLRNNGTVDLSYTVTRLTGHRSPFKFGPYKGNVPLGAAWGPTIGTVKFATKVSLPK